MAKQQRRRRKSRNFSLDDVAPPNSTLRDKVGAIIDDMELTSRISYNVYLVPDGAIVSLSQRIAGLPEHPLVVSEGAKDVGVRYRKRKTEDVTEDAGDAIVDVDNTPETTIVVVSTKSSTPTSRKQRSDKGRKRGKRNPLLIKGAEI